MTTPRPSNPTGDRERLLELLADERFGMLAPEDRPELDRLLAQAGDAEELDHALGELLVALDAASDAEDAAVDLPEDLRARVVGAGSGLVAVKPGAPDAATLRLADREADRQDGQNQSPARGWWIPTLIAAGLLAAISAAVIISVNARQRLTESQQRIAELEQQVEQNAETIRVARANADRLRTDLAARGTELTEAERQLALATQRNLDLAQDLASATSDLERAQLEIARYEQPRDPAELAENRRKLLDVPGTVRLAWAPFDLPDAPAEQRDVTGDVIWNDELQTGYLRFVGLDVNDPNIEQYQVWVIDERGMEQKVSGGVFNASAEGEVIVPIEPGIDVGRVALFAITVEDPGGTWVPDLERRVVVAPRDS